jgi:hypothetical protein
MTTVSLDVMRQIPMVAAICILVAFVFRFLRNRLVWWTFLVLLGEVLVLSYVILGVWLPGKSITYRFAP